jgi:hypothetical protein
MTETSSGDDYLGAQRHVTVGPDGRIAAWPM